MKKNLFLVIIIFLAISHATGQQLGEVSFSRTTDFKRIILANGDFIDSGAFCSRINDDKANYLLIFDFGTQESVEKVVMPYPAFLEAIDALEKMSDDKPLPSGQGEKVYKYKEFSIGWMQFHDDINWLISINNNPSLYINAESYEELHNALITIKQYMYDFMWGLI